MIGRVASVTDPGRKRRRNEDAFVCEPPLFAVADGVGGAHAGEVASRLAAAALKETQPEAPGGEERLVGLIQEANRRVYDRSHEDPSASGMGTTITVALVEDGNVSFGHVGDSRAYLIRDGELEQLTEDHSLVAELMRSGKLSPEEAETHPQRSVITRALGTDPDVDIDTFTIAAQPEDVYLICSDGLSSMVSGEEILGLVKEHREDMERAARALVQAANKGGGEDNITVVTFEIADDGAHDGETREQAVPAEAMDEAQPEEEDTLTEADAVPVVDTMVLSTDEIQAQVDADRKVERRKRSRRVLVWFVVLLLVAAAAALLVWKLLD